ncbi:oocyte zinc finger protein XlCOF6-like isoform X2 [Periophthalmus magnuspinnatus]|uniref:oocyte zinc finger protein XlCOF6-like isoform X2 n=1 Tax=Periophthalmus magnuspinnatus TaxID=409849 RepID=UPI002436BD12|nr:oocyte zinc finger protein XlCOF6-like isoform X2 [Periophthalmus magnuspinnatus]
MSKGQTLRALVNERLTAAAEEIFALFERTIAEYEEELCRSKEENQRNQDTPQTPRIKEEPEEQSVKQEEDTLPAQLPVGIPEFSVVCVKTEESSLLQHRQTEHREETQGEDISTEPHLHSETEGHMEHSSDTDNDENWRAPFSCSAAQMETEADGDHCKQVQKGQTLRALVNERLTAAAEEIFALFERTTAEYEEELYRSKEENQRNQDTPQTPWIKEEQSVKQEEDTLPAQLPVGVPEFSVVCVKTEESSLLQHRQSEHREETRGEDISTEPHLHSETEGHMEHSSDTDDDEDWRAPFSCSAAQMETGADGDHCNQVQMRARSTAASNSGADLYLGNRPETSATVNYGDTSETAQEAEGKKFECPMCQKRFGTMQKLETHIRVHTGERPFSCVLCLKTFTTKGSLDKHVKIHSGERPYSCSTCDKTFTQKHGLDYHVKTHTGDKPFSCSICKKTFFVKSSLVRHLRTHTGDRPYSCSTCEKTFTMKSHLDTHIKIHTGEKPYSCSTCEKTFTQKSSLDYHEKKHSGEKPFSCSICEKTFCDKSALVQHLRTHTGERPYSCSTCEKTFVTKSNLEKHERTHTGERPYSCSICNKGFKLKQHLKKHMRTHKTESD